MAGIHLATYFYHSIMGSLEFSSDQPDVWVVSMPIASTSISPKPGCSCLATFGSCYFALYPVQPGTSSTRPLALDSPALLPTSLPPISFTSQLLSTFFSAQSGLTAQLSASISELPSSSTQPYPDSP